MTAHVAELKAKELVKKFTRGSGTHLPYRTHDSMIAGWTPARATNFK